jgi:ribose transport system ATP-binding protein
MMTGGIDLSVGPLAGLLVVVASFFINDGSPFMSMLLGLITMIVVGAVVGLVNSTLIRYVKFTAIAATLTTYIALGGFSFILRDAPGGYISQDVTKIINAKLGPIPYSFILLVLVTVGMEYLLRKSRWGWQLRAVGSNEESARRIGVPVAGTVIGAYVISSLFVFLGSLMLMVQIGVGDPTQGVGYTLASITAVVLGGTSLMGGRGTFVGTLMGAVLINQVLNATVFLGLDQTWQYLLQAALILVAAVVYSVLRSRKSA